MKKVLIYYDIDSKKLFNKLKVDYKIYNNQKNITELVIKNLNFYKFKNSKKIFLDSYRSIKNRSRFFAYLLKFAKFNTDINISGINVFDASKYHILARYEKYFYNIDLVEKISKFKNSKIIWFYTSNYFFDNNYYKKIKFLSNSYNLNIEFIKIDDSIFYRKIISYVYRKLLVFLTFLSINLTFSFLRKEIIPKTKILIFEYFKNSFKLHKNLNFNQKSKVTYLNYNSVTYSNYKKNNFTSFLCQRIFFFEDIFNIFKVKQKIKDKLNKKNNLEIIKKYDAFNYVIAENSHLILLEICTTKNTINYYLNQVNPKFIISSTFSSIFGFVLSETAKQKKIKNFYIPHGNNNYAKYNSYINYDNVIVWSEHDKKKLEKNYRKKISILGPHIFQNLIDFRNKKIINKKSKIICYFPSRTAGYVVNQYESLEILDAYLELAKAHPNFTFLIKKHPQDSFNLEEDVEKFNLSNVRFTKITESNLSILKKVNIVIVSSSTVVFEAAILNKIIIIYQIRENNYLNIDTIDSFHFVKNRKTLIKTFDYLNFDYNKNFNFHKKFINNRLNGLKIINLESLLK